MYGSPSDDDQQQLDTLLRNASTFLMETADLLGHVEEDLRLVRARARSVPRGECRDRATQCRQVARLLEDKCRDLGELNLPAPVR